MANERRIYNRLGKKKAQAREPESVIILDDIDEDENMDGEHLPEANSFTAPGTLDINNTENIEIDEAQLELEFLSLPEPANITSVSPAVSHIQEGVKTITSYGEFTSSSDHGQLIRLPPCPQP
jgi:hypothetical protein